MVNEALEAVGNELDNLITGNELNNLLVGRKGRDTLDGGAGGDRLEGGFGNDVYVVDNVGDQVIEAPGTGIDTIQSSLSLGLEKWVENLTLTGIDDLNGIGNGRSNVLTGNDGNNFLRGGGGQDTLYGANGHNTLHGGNGIDSLVGGDGHDVFFVGSAADLVIEDPGAGIDTIESNVSFVLPTNVERLFLKGLGNIDGTGDELNNILIPLS